MVHPFRTCGWGRTSRFTVRGGSIGGCRPRHKPMRKENTGLRTFRRARYFLQAIRNDDANKPGRQFEAAFYPAAARIDDAESLRVAVGEEKRSIDFWLSDAAIHSVSGRVAFLDSGQPFPNMALRVYA